MTVEIKVPGLPESVADATVSEWYKKPGEAVKRDEKLVDLETDKIMLEVPAPADGVMTEIKKNEGDVVTADEILAIIDTKATASEAPAAEKTEAAQSEAAPAKKEDLDTEDGAISPSVRRLMAENDIKASDVTATGKGGRIVKEDVEKAITAKASKPDQESASAPISPAGAREEKRVPMSRMRAKIAERLLEAKQSTAMLTTFNEVNMKPIMDIRARYKDEFIKSHDVKLGFMSFFVKAAVEALKKYPILNSSIDGNDIVYHGYFDVGIAVSTERGLVVPVIRDADKLSMAEIEKQIIEYGKKARDGKLTLEDMQGGTFTITNGGVFGSMLSTPLINPPQCAILGMHNIVERAVVEKGQVVVRPIMYLAMSYDHRIIDGKDSVTFLKSIKESLEDPARLILSL